MREIVNLRIYRLNEQMNQRELDFDYTDEQRTFIVDDIERLLQGAHIIDEQGNVYVIGIIDIVEDD